MPAPLPFSTSCSFLQIQCFLFFCFFQKQLSHVNVLFALLHLWEEGRKPCREQRTVHTLPSGTIRMKILMAILLKSASLPTVTIQVQLFPLFLPSLFLVSRFTSLGKCATISYCPILINLTHCPSTTQRE